jgi:hypothetical protein
MPLLGWSPKGLLASPYVAAHWSARVYFAVVSPLDLYMTAVTTYRGYLVVWMSGYVSGYGYRR